METFLTIMAAFGLFLVAVSFILMGLSLFFDDEDNILFRCGISLLLFTMLTAISVLALCGAYVTLASI